MMKCNRGDVVLVRYPNSDLVTWKPRPALIVQGDQFESGIDQKIVAMITSNLSRQGKTRVAIAMNSDVGIKMGLRTDSIIVADNLGTVRLSEIYKVIGLCEAMQDVDLALKFALQLI